jgi:hypothetical protein
VSTFNRILTVLFLLGLLVLAVLFALRPDQTIEAVQRALDNMSTFLTGMQSSYRWLYVLGRIAFALLAIAILGPLLWVELQPRRVKSVNVQTEAGNRASVGTDSVARRLAWHIDQIADVISVTPQVSAHGKSVDVLLDLETSPEIDVPMKTDEVVAVAREVLEERMGLQSGKIKVQMKHSPYRDEA